MEQRTLRHIQPPEILRRSNWRDRYETKVNQWITPWDGQESIEVGLIGAPFSRASISLSGAFATPNQLRLLFSALQTYNVDEDIDLAHVPVRDLGDIPMHVTDVLRSHQNIEAALTEVAVEHPHVLPIVIGGDHSITAPAVRGFRKRYEGKIGIIQFDAHFDVRNLEDGGPSNGTPMRQLLEAGTVAGSNVAQIGIHNYANSQKYRQYVDEQGVTFFTSRDVRRQGMQAIVEQALAVAGRGTEAIYVTVDIDVLDQAYAPGVPAMVAAGMSTWDLLEGIRMLGEVEKVKGLDIVCVDPNQDYRQATVRVVGNVLLQFLTGYAQRKK